ncbi:hypothetical protein, partial [Streptomyces chartreusis]
DPFAVLAELVVDESVAVDWYVALLHPAGTDLPASVEFDGSWYGFDLASPDVGGALLNVARVTGLSGTNTVGGVNQNGSGAFDWSQIQAQLGLQPEAPDVSDLLADSSAGAPGELEVPSQTVTAGPSRRARERRKHERLAAESQSKKKQGRFSELPAEMVDYVGSFLNDVERGAMAQADQRTYGVLGSTALSRTQAEFDEALGRPNVRAIHMRPKGQTRIEVRDPIPRKVHFFADGAASAGIVDFYAEAELTASASARVIAHAGSVTASGSASIVAGDLARVTASDDVDVQAHGKAHIRVSGSARVEASGDVTVEAFDMAHVTATDRVHVEARGNSQVEAYKSADVVGDDEAEVNAFNQSTVTVKGAAWAFVNGDVRVKASGEARVIVQGPDVRVLVLKGSAVTVVGDASDTAVVLRTNGWPDGYNF